MLCDRRVVATPSSACQGHSPGYLPGIPHMSHNPLRKWSLMIAHPRPLIEVFAAIPDFRKPRGKRHPLTAIFALACCAMLCGYRSYSAMAEWGRNYGARIAQALGFTHATPCAATLHTIFRHVNRDEFEAHLGPGPTVWSGVCPQHRRRLRSRWPSMAKRCGAPKNKGRQGPTCYRRSRTMWGSPWPNTPLTTKPMRSRPSRPSCSQLVLEGRIVTMDALLTQRHVAQTIVDKGGDYVMIVKENQPQLRADIELVFTLPPVGRPARDRAHGGHRAWAHRAAQYHDE